MGVSSWRTNHHDPFTSISKVTNGVLSLTRMALIDEDLPRVLVGDLSGVTSLVLRENSVSGEGLLFLAGRATLRLVKLNLAANGLDDESLRFLGEARWELRELLLNRNSIRGHGLKHLRHVPFDKLELLNLNENQITDRGAEELSRWKCPALLTLLLFGNKLKDSGVIVLLEWRIPLLQCLHIAGNSHSGQGVAALLRGRWPGMREMQLYGELLGHWEQQFLLRLLQARWPDCQIFL